MNVVANGTFMYTKHGTANLSTGTHLAPKPAQIQLESRLEVIQGHAVRHH